jgi:hypothetical protein
VPKLSNLKDIAMTLNQAHSALRAMLVVCATSAVLPAMAADNLVANGALDFGGPGAPAQWSFLNPAGEFWNSYGGAASPGGGSYLGIQDLDAFFPRFNVGGFTQNVSGLEVGATYTLTFYSMTNHDAFDPAARQDWIVTFGPSQLTGQQTWYTGNSEWVQSSLVFTAQATTQALTFVAEFLPGSYPEMLNIDDIALTRTAGAVPEPASAALLLGGLLVVGAAARRRSLG